MPKPRKDYSYLIGQKFGKFSVTQLLPREIGKKPKARVVCDCGAVKDVLIVDMVRGKVRSCGCPSQPRNKDAEEYGIWQGMKNRCLNPRNPAFDRYGGRGITVCDRWKDSFTDFLSDIGPRPSPKMSLDRIDNGRGYEPGNVRWTDNRTQCNNKRTNIFVTIDGITKSVSEWSRSLGVHRSMVYARISKGMDAEAALLTPSGDASIRIKKRRRGVKTK